MRGLFGLVGLLVALVVVGMLVRKQMTANRVAVPTLDTPTTAPVNASPAQGNVVQQNQQIQQQIKQAVEGAMQARPVPEDK
jgi:hypothetical protein